MTTKLDLKKMVFEYLKTSKLMTVSTCSGNVPWAATVFFVSDQDLNLYFLSDPSTRHGQEIKNNSLVAVTISRLVKGIQLQGKAVNLGLPKKEIELFLEKYTWAKDYLSSHALFKITPVRVYYIDSEVLGKNVREEVKL